jgi:hypothetical protein
MPNLDLNVMENGSTLIQSGRQSALRRGYRRPGRAPFQPRAVCLWAELGIGRKGPDILEPAGHIHAALLARAVGHPVRSPYKDRLGVAVPLRASILPRATPGAVRNPSAMQGAGYFGLQKGGPMFTVNLLLVNVPFGTITALVAKTIIGAKP